MGKKIRINGYDTNALTRQESITDKKKITGYNSQTYQKGNETKQKMQIALEEDFETLEQIEDMLSNPKFQTTKVMGLQENEKVIVHNNNFKHGHGVLNHIAADGVEVKEFGVKSDVHNIAKQDKWQIVVEEDFNSTNFPSNISLNYNQNSSGLSNQERTITYKNNSQTATIQRSTVSNYGGQSIKLNNLAIFTLNHTAMYDNFDAEFVWKHTNGSQGLFNFMFARVGYQYSGGTHTFIRFDLGNNEIILVNSYDNPEVLRYKDKVNLVADTWYTTRVVKIHKDIIVYLNGVKVADFKLKDNVYGNFAFYPNYSSAYLDKLVIKTIPHQMLSLPENSKTQDESTTYETPFGKGHKIFGKQIQEFKHGVPEDSKLHLDFRENKGNKLIDKSGNSNDAYVRNGEWVDGYFYKGVKVSEGSVLIEDDSTISDLSEFNLHTRFKLQNLEQTKRSLQANPIISKGNEFTVYDYKKPDSLVGWWKLDGDYTDSSGYGYDGSLPVNTSVVAGKQFDNAINFTNASVKIGDFNPIDYNNPQATFSAWVKLNSNVTGFHTIFAKWNNSTSQRAYGFWLDENGGKQRIHLATKTSSTTYTAYSSDFAFTTDEWAHFALVWNRGKVRFFLNGQILNEADMNMTNFSYEFEGWNEDLYLGAQQQGTANKIDGAMQDIRIYNSAMTDKEISRIYNNGEGLKTKLNRHHLAFEIYGELLIGDTIEENEWIEAWLLCDGKSSFIYRREGQEVVPEARLPLGSLYVYAPLDESEEDKSIYNHTVGLPYGAISYEHRSILNKGYTHTSDSNKRIDYTTALVPARRTKFSIAAWINSADIDWSTKNGTSFIVGFGSYQDSFGLTHYVNGRIGFQSRDSANAFDGIAYYNGNLGEWNHYVGVIDESSMKLYVNGKLFSQDFTLSSGSISTGTESVKIGGGNLLSGNGTLRYFQGQIDDVRFYLRDLSDEEIEFLYSRGNYFHDMNINSKGYDTINRESGLVGHFSLNNNGKDTSIYRQDLTVTNGSIAYVDGIINKAASFNGSSAFELPSLLPLKEAFSIAFWVNLQSNNRGIIFASLDNSGTTPWFAIDKQSNNKIRFEIQTSDGNNFYDSSVLSLSTWYHVTCTYDNGVMKTYINSALDASDPHTGSVYNDGNTMAIGKYGGYSSSPSYFNGYLDDFRIYNYALDENEISQLYNSGNGTESKSYNTLTMDLLDLQDKFYLPHRHLDGISQVRVWDLEYDKIENAFMKSLLNHAPMERRGRREDYIKNVYDETAYIERGAGAASDRFTTDTWSKYVANAPTVDYATNGYADGWSWRKKGAANLTNADVNNDQTIYEQTISFWYRSEQAGSKYILSAKIDADTSGWYLIQNGFHWEGSTGTGVVHNIDFQNDFIDNQWRKMDIVFSYGTTTFYVDGEAYSYEDNSATYGKYIVPNTGQRMRVDGYNTGFDISHVKMYDRALTAQEIKESFIYDPINPYYNSKQIFSRYYEQDSKNAIFVENGLFGMLIHKALPAEAKRSTGGVDFYRWDNGWKSVGKLMTEKSD